MVALSESRRAGPSRSGAAPFLEEAAVEPVRVIELASAVAPRVSVIVATYNRRALVLDALAALSRLEGPAFEAVIVDDGSSDGTSDAVEEEARRLGLAGRLVVLPRNRGVAVARNVAIVHARAETIAITDSDCLPSPQWLEQGLAAFEASTAIVQGRVTAPPDARPPFFSHFIETDRLDGSFSTSNIFYRREAIEAAGGFDPGCDYWEDLDLGVRVMRLGWRARFAPSALVYHQVLPTRWLDWLRRPRLLNNRPAAVARYPEWRRYMFARYWVDSTHALLTGAIAGLALAPLFLPAALLALPYAASIPRRYGLGGRLPVVKAALHAWWDIFGWITLARASVRHRVVVL